MVNFNPIRGGLAAVTPPTTSITPTGTGLTRAVVLERDRQRKQRNPQQEPETSPEDEQPQSEQHHGKSDYPVYNPHAGLTPESETKSPLDVIA